MGAPYTNLLTKVEDAVYTYFKSVCDISSVNWYRSIEIISNETGLQLPFIVISASNSEPVEESENLNDSACNERVTVGIVIRSVSKDIKDDAANDTGMVLQTCRQFHDLIVGTIKDAIYLPHTSADPDTLIRLTTALENQGIEGIGFDVVHRPHQEFGPGAGNTYRTMITLQIECHPKL